MSVSQPIHPALDFTSDTAYVGVYDDKRELWLIAASGTGRQKLKSDTLTVCPRPCVAPPSELVGRWKPTDWDAFVADGAAPSIGDTLTRVRDVLGGHVEFPQPEDASLVALWILGTYFHRSSFLTYPRLNLHGEKGSGKSKLLRLIQQLAFNGMMRLAPTPAVLFRRIEELRPTLCLDEMENLGDDRATIVSIINSGYKLGGAIDRTEERNGQRV